MDDFQKVSLLNTGIRFYAKSAAVVGKTGAGEGKTKDVLKISVVRKNKTLAL